jgi:RNA polymerase sigma-70 factor (ECF subfamily)
VSRVPFKAMQALERSEAEDPGWSLLEQVAAGDATAFDALMRQHQDRVLAVCQRLLGNRPEAEDATQEVFVKAYRQAGSLEPRGQVYTWLYRVAVNHCLNLLRRSRIVRFVPLVRGRANDEESPFEIDPLEPSADPERAAEARQRWRRTERLIAALPDNQKAVLVLARFEGLSYREIAETLEISEGAVESRLFRAMRNLHKAQET